MTLLGRITFAWPMDVTQCSTQRFHFLFVRVFLALSQFKGFEDLIHVLETFPQQIDNAVNLLNRLLHTHRGRGLRVPRRWTGRLNNRTRRRDRCWSFSGVHWRPGFGGVGFRRMGMLRLLLRWAASSAATPSSAGAPATAPGWRC